MTDTPKPKQAREWPGNDIARLTEDDRILHDHLCELLSDTASENDVCMASVGIWGALSVMRDKMNLLLIETDACRTRIKDQAEALERGYALGIEFNKVAKERDELMATLNGTYKGDFKLLESMSLAQQTMHARRKAEQDLDEARSEAERLNIQAGIYSLEADKWKALAEKMAAALKDVQSWLAEHEGLVSIPAEEALAEFDAGKK